MRATVEGSRQLGSGCAARLRTLPLRPLSRRVPGVRDYVTAVLQIAQKMDIERCAASAEASSLLAVATLMARIAHSWTLDHNSSTTNGVAS